MERSVNARCRAVVLICLIFGGMILPRLGDASEIAKDIQLVALQIDTAKEEGSHYSGGLVKSLIDLRVQILENTKAMLEQRRYALRHGTSVQYTYRGQIYEPRPADQATLDALESEIRDQQAKLSEAKTEGARYSGGLVKAMTVSRTATIRNTMAILDQRRLTAKYGMPLLALPDQADSSSAPEKETEAVPDTPSGAKIEVVDWTNRMSASGNYVHIEGVLRNVGRKTANSVKVKVKSLDQQGKLVSIEDGYADPPTIAPGGEATFQIMVEDHPAIKKFNLSVLWR